MTLNKACLLSTLGVIALSASGLAQAPSVIPTDAKWELTFREVEAAAGLPDLRQPAPNVFEARVMERPWSSGGPLPFLRIVRRDGHDDPQLFVFWSTPRLSRFPPALRPDTVCRDQICVQPVDLGVERSWGQMLLTLANEDACPSEILSICGDCEALWIKSASEGAYREQYCEQEKTRAGVDALLPLMQSAVRAAGY